MRGVPDGHVVEQQRRVAERRVDVLVDRDRLHRGPSVEVARPEVTCGPSARRPVRVQAADRPVAEPEIPVAAGVVAGGRFVAVYPLIGTGLAPELDVAAVVSVGDQVVVAELVPGIRRAGELGLMRLGRGRRVDRVGVGRKAEAIDAPSPECAAAVAGGEVGNAPIGGQRRRAGAEGRLGEHGRDDEHRGQAAGRPGGRAQLFFLSMLAPESRNFIPPLRPPAHLRSAFRPVQ